MVANEFKLNGKTALVAGDGRFWVKYAAAALAGAGADVAIAANNSRKLEDAVAEVRRLGKKAVPILADLTSSSQVQKMAEKAIAELGRIDILVNAADSLFVKPFIEITEDEWH